jgi:hypothetical protein
MPETAPQAKQQATKGYGAQVILKGKNFNETRLYMEELVVSLVVRFQASRLWHLYLIVLLLKLRLSYFKR